MLIRKVQASVAQRLLWFLHHYRASSGALNCPVVCSMHGAVDVERLRKCTGQLVARHEALRTTIERRKRGLWQLVHDVGHPEFKVIDLRDEIDPEASALARVHDDLHTRIDPGHCPVRATLWRLAEFRYIFCLNVHHLASDAASGAIQMQDLLALYEGGAGAMVCLPPVGLQYVDFTMRQEEYFRSEAFARDRQYWCQRLVAASYDSVPLAPASGGGQRETVKEEIFIGAGETSSLIALARDWNTTIFSLMLTLYFAVIHRVTGKCDLSVASLFTNRLRPDIQRTVGFLANLALLRTLVEPEAVFPALQRSVQDSIREAFVRQAYPMHLLPATVTVQNGRRADEVVFQMLPERLGRYKMGEVDVEMLAPPLLDSRFEFEVTIVRKQSALAVVVLWNRTRLDEGWVSNFLREYRRSVAAILRDPDWLFAASA